MHDCAFYGSWGAVWHYMSHWLHPLRQLRMAHLGPIPLPFQSRLACCWERIARSRQEAASHPSFATLMPAAAHFPDVHSVLLHGHASPATAPLGAPPVAPPLSASAHRIYDLDAFDDGSYPDLQTDAASAVHALSFLSLYDSSDAVGRARLLDGSVSSGPPTWLRRVPAPPPSPELAPGTFQLHSPHDFPITLAVDLLLRPPIPDVPPGHATVCTHCAHRGRDCEVGLDGRHWSSVCPRGIRRQRTMHHPTRDALGIICQAVLGASRVITSSGPRLAETALAQHARDHLVRRIPDLALRDFRYPGSWTYVEVRSLDTCGATHITTHHTDTTRLAAHLAAERAAVPQYHPLPPHSDLVVFAISPYGAIGPQGLTLLRQLSRASGGALPPVLLDEASWATPTMGDYARMAVTLAARRSLALAIRQTWGAASVAHADWDLVTLDDDDDPSDAEEEAERMLWSDA